MLAVTQFSGCFALTGYAATIFKESGSMINPHLSSIIVGVFQLIGSILASSLIDRLGRRFLLLVSCAGSALSLFLTGIYSYLHSTGYDVSSWSYLPIISLSVFVIITAIGLMPVPLVLVTEVLPQKVTFKEFIKQTANKYFNNLILSRFDELDLRFRRALCVCLASLC